MIVRLKVPLEGWLYKVVTSFNSMIVRLKEYFNNKKINKKKVSIL